MLRKEYTERLSKSSKSVMQVTQKALPVPYQFDLDLLRKNTPPSLKSARVWLCWKYEDRGGKSTKVPYSPHGGEGKSNDPKTWGSFEQAISTTLRLGYSGVGIAVTGDLVAFDIDKIKDTERGKKQLAALASAGLDYQQLVNQILETFQGRAYIERSPSGDGLRILVHGNIPTDARKKGQARLGLDWIEGYGASSPRYVTLTGNLLGEPVDLDTAQSCIDWMVDQFLKKEKQVASPRPVGTLAALDDYSLLEKIRASSNSSEFFRLYAGEAGSDHSAADLALCNSLAWWCNGDASQMDRIFRSSGLFREKWDRRCGDTTYGEMTIQKALAACHGGYDPAYKPTPPSRTTKPSEPKKKKPSEKLKLLQQYEEKSQRTDVNAPSQYLGSLPKTKGILAVKSSLGTGKTEAAKELCARYNDGLWVAHRIALTRNTEERLSDLGFQHYQDIDGPIKSSRAIVCIDSIDRVKYVPHLCVADEADQMLQSIVKLASMGDTDAILTKVSRLKTILRKTEQNVLSSAHLDQWTIKVFADLAGKDVSDVHHIEHTWEHPDQSWRFFPQAKECREAVKASWLRGERLAIFCASREQAKVKAEWLQMLRPDAKVTCIHKQAEDEARDTLSAVNDRWSELDAVIFTSSAGSGVSFDVKDHFDRVLVWGRNAPHDLPASEFLQGAARVRHPKSREVWAYLDGRERKPRSRDEIAEHLRAKERKTLETLRSLEGFTVNAQREIVRSENDPLAASVLLDALAQREERSAAPLRWILETLHQRGIKIVVDTSKTGTRRAKETKAQLEEASHQVEVKRIEELDNAPNLTRKEAEQLQNKELKRKDQIALEHHEIAAFYSEPIQDDETPPRADPRVVLKDKKGRKRKQIRRLVKALAYRECPEYFADLDRKDLLEDPAEHDPLKRGKVRSSVDARHHAQEAELLSDLLRVVEARHHEIESVATLQTRLEEESSKSNSYKVATQLIGSSTFSFSSLCGHFTEKGNLKQAVAILQRTDLARCGDLKVRGFDLASPTEKLVGDIAAYFGIKRTSTREQINGKRVRKYFLDVEEWGETLRLARGEMMRVKEKLQLWQDEQDRLRSLCGHTESEPEQLLCGHTKERFNTHTQAEPYCPFEDPANFEDQTLEEILSELPPWKIVGDT